MKSSRTGRFQVPHSCIAGRRRKIIAKDIPGVNI